MKQMKGKLQLILISFVLLMSPVMLIGQPVNAPNLGEATHFTLFTAVGAIGSAGTTLVRGDIGTNSGPITGFPPGKVIGQTHLGDVVTLQASTDVFNAYSYLAGMTPTFVAPVTLGNGQTLLPGIYATGAATTLNGDLTLDGLGDPNALFVIQIDGAFSTSTFARVLMVNSASYCNVYWQVNGAFNLGDDAVFRGTVVANGAITLLSNATIFGRSLSKAGAINLSSVAATMPIPFAVTIKSDKDYLYTNESATYTTKITCGCPENNVSPRIDVPLGLTYLNGGTFAANKVTFPAATFAEGQSISYDFEAKLNNTITPPTSIFYDGVEGAAKFTASTLSGSMPTFSINNTTPLFELKSWAVGYDILPSDVALTLNTAIPIPATGNYSLHFNHQYTTENAHDGGVIEFSINGGTSWTDAATMFTQNGYDRNIDSTIDNPLIFRDAFTGSSNGKKESIINVSSFIGQNLLFRFRFGTDTGNNGTGFTGWKIDRIWLANTVDCLPLIAEVMQNTLSKAADTICQEISAMPLNFSLNCPADIVSCTNPVVNYPPDSITNFQGLTNLTYSIPSGSTFAVGVTSVVVTAQDAVGNTDSCHFNVYIGNPPSSITSGVNTSSINACVGSFVTLTSSFSSEYAWFRNGSYIGVYSNISPNCVIPYVLVGTNEYKVITINSQGCLSDLSANFNVIGDEPNVIITPSGLTVFCANTPTTLNAAAGLGYTYSWVCTTCAGSPNVASASYIPTGSGNHKVIVTQNGCAKSSLWQSISILPLPNANAGADKSVCINASATLGVNPTLGYSYTWSPSTNLSASNIANPIVTPNLQTMIPYTLTVTNTNTGCVNMDEVDITGLTLPTTPNLLSNQSGLLCQGMSVSLSPSGPSGAVNWYKNATLFAAANGPSARAIVASSLTEDLYSIRAKSATAGACLSESSNEVAVWIHLAPMPTISANPAAVGPVVSICAPGMTSATAGLTAQLASGSPLATYNWQQFVAGLPTNLVPVATSSNYTATVSTSPSSQNNKIFRVQATYSSGCVKSSNNITVKLLPSGCAPSKYSSNDANSSQEQAIFSVYPNPTEGLLNVSIQNIAEFEGKLQVYNTLGQILVERNILLMDGKAEELLDISNLPAGIYTLAFQTKAGMQVQKVIKE